MTETVSLFKFLLPALIVSIAVVLLCFYLRVKKKRATYDVTVPPREDDGISSVLCTISLSGDRAEEDRLRDRFPPRYSTVDHPPPYSMFDPNLAPVWAGGPPPAYEMYPITLPLAPGRWMTPTGPGHPTTPAIPSTPNPQPQRSHQAPSS